MWVGDVGEMCGEGVGVVGSMPVSRLESIPLAGIYK